MFIIPPSYYLRKSIKSDTMQEAFENYMHFLEQMNRHSFWFAKQYIDAWTKFVNASVV